MCGIAGYAQTSPIYGPEVLRRMVASLNRRGPDSEGHYASGRTGIGMRRLSIIDLEGGSQPVFSHDRRFVLVFNGEIYNYESLRTELIAQGHEFKSHGDAEVIVKLYAQLGYKALDRLRGMFAVAIWDSREEELFLARDQIGIKPLFYSIIGEELVFGSEIKSLLEALPKKLDIDAQALDAFLAYTYIPAPFTIWKDVRKLAPGHFLLWKDGKTRITKYWDLIETGDCEEVSLDGIRSSIDESVKCHMVSDVEVGAFLSGGLDSSTLVARSVGHADSKISAFSLRFGEPGHLVDETQLAEELKDRYNFELHVRTLNPDGFDLLHDGMRAFDEPFADDSIIPNYDLSEFASRDLKVVLSGAGGDEVFGGYNRYQGVVVAERLRSLPSWLRRHLIGPLITFLARILGRGGRRGNLADRFSKVMHLNRIETYLSFVTTTSKRVRRSLLSDQVINLVDQDTTSALISNPLARADKLSPLKQAMYADFCTYLPDDILALSDRIGMWHSLEIRTPFADKILAEQLFGLADEQLLNVYSKKIALRSAVRSWLPSRIIDHPKQGFEAPTARWLRTDGQHVFQRQLTRTKETMGTLIDLDKIDLLFKDHMDGRSDNAKILFALYSLSIWVELFAGRIGGLR